VLVAHHLPKLGAHLVTARPVEEIVWRQETRGRKKARGSGAETLPQQVIKNSAAVQQDIYVFVYSGESILAAMYLRRARIEGRSYAAAPTQVSTVAPAAKHLGVGLRRPCSADA
jgi:hypothetical protein